MADFCNKCAQEMWDDQCEPEINIEKISETLEPGHFESVLCEGCGVRAVGKTADGLIIIAILEEEGSVEDSVTWVPLEKWLESEKTI
jgi:hypothetical protein